MRRRYHPRQMSASPPSLTAAAALLDRWYVVAAARDVVGGPLGVRVLDRGLVLWRDADGAIVATFDRCPHREAPLSEGHVDDAGCLVCPYHGWTFGGDGRCLRVPSASAGTPVPPAAHLPVLPVRERHGLVWINLGSPIGEPPHVPEDDDPSFRRLHGEIERWNVSVTRMVDNFCDVAHFPFVHGGTLGADVDEVVARVEVEELDADFTGYRYAVEVDNASGERVRQSMTTGFHLPFTVRSTTRFESGPDEGSERVLMLCSTPIDDRSSLFTFVVWRNSDAGLSDAEQLAFDRAVGAEDRAMLERIPGPLSLDVTTTANVQSDRLSIEWRRRLAALVDDG